MCKSIEKYNSFTIVYNQFLVFGQNYNWEHFFFWKLIPEREQFSNSGIFTGDVGSNDGIIRMDLHLLILMELYTKISFTFKLE